MGNKEDNVISHKSDLISIELGNLNYYESQLLSGNVKLEPNSEIIVNGINIQLKRIQCFYLSKNQTNNFNEVLFVENLDISKHFKKANNNNNSFKAPRGIHRIPFEKFLPSGIPPSFEYPHSSKKGYIRYILTAELVLENEKEKHLSEEYICIKQRPFNVPSNFRYSDAKTIKKKGESCLNIYIGSLDLIINNPIKIGLEIDNKKCEDNSKKIKIKVFRTITLKSINEDIKSETKIIEKNYPFKCLKGETMKNDYEDILFRDEDLKDINFEDKVNPYLGNIYDVNLLMPSFESEIIKCEYRLEIYSSYNTDLDKKDRPTIILPIYAVHQTLLEYEGNKNIIEEQKNNLIKSKVFQTNKNINNNNNENLSKLNPYSPENNFGKKKNINNNYKKINVGIGPANPYQSFISNFPTMKSIIAVNSIKNEDNIKKGNQNNEQKKVNNNDINNL